MNNKLQLILLVGPSGCGKTTWSSEFCAYNPNTVLLSPDSMRYVLSGDESNQTCNRNVFFIIGNMAHYFMLFKRSPILIDATNLTVKNRKMFVELGKKFNYEICAKIFQTSFQECLENNQNRERVVPKDVIERQFNSYVMPTKEEGFNEIEFVDHRKDAAPGNLMAAELRKKCNSWTKAQREYYHKVGLKLINQGVNADKAMQEAERIVNEYKLEDFNKQIINDTLSYGIDPTEGI